LVETAILKKYQSKRMISNHEWVFDVNLQHIINSTRTICDMLNIEYTEDDDLPSYNNQILADYD
jgi:hypothetical protein